MSQSDPPSFHLRLPARLKADLQAARGANSLNGEIVERLERSFDPDPSLRLAEIMRPFLVELSEEDQAKLLDLASGFVGILMKRNRKSR
ncbi:hypothetical protein [Mesorhizobium sp. GbtcB19]|uniref:hypothetical protein n=1 Tax=Mesorhizobium sp. GbtcB19 TaxID=2824764 RepID=UPI001C2FAF16|nr:hypothetical protein [Mesorhizobium sp. GbtcB19]